MPWCSLKRRRLPPGSWACRPSGGASPGHWTKKDSDRWSHARAALPHGGSTSRRFPNDPKDDRTTSWSPSATRSTTRSSRATMGSGRGRYAAGDTPTPLGRHEIHVRDRGRGGDLTPAEQPVHQQRRNGAGGRAHTPSDASHATPIAPRRASAAHPVARQAKARGGLASAPRRARHVDRPGVVDVRDARAGCSGLFRVPRWRVTGEPALAARWHRLCRS